MMKEGEALKNTGADTSIVTIERRGFVLPTDAKPESGLSLCLCAAPFSLVVEK